MFRRRKEQEDAHEREISFWKTEMEKVVQEKNTWVQKYLRASEDNEMLRAELFLAQRETHATRAQLEVARKKNECRAASLSPSVAVGSSTATPRSPGAPNEAPLADAVNAMFRPSAGAGGSATAGGTTPNRSVAQSQTNPFNRSVAALEEQVTDLKSELNRMQRQLEAAEAAAHQSDMRVALLEERLEEAARELEAARRQTERLREVAEAHAVAAAAAHGVEVRVKQLEERLAEAAREVEAARRQTEFMRTTAEAHQHEADALRAEVLSQRSINDETANETTKILCELSSAQQRCAKLASELSIKEQMVSLLQLQLGDLAAAAAGGLTPAATAAAVAAAAAAGPPASNGSVNLSYSYSGWSLAPMSRASVLGAGSGVAAALLGAGSGVTGTIRSVAAAEGEEGGEQEEVGEQENQQQEDEPPMEAAVVTTSHDARSPVAVTTADPTTTTAATSTEQKGAAEANGAAAVEARSPAPALQRTVSWAKDGDGTRNGVGLGVGKKEVGVAFQETGMQVDLTPSPQPPGVLRMSLSKGFAAAAAAAASTSGTSSPSAIQYTMFQRPQPPAPSSTAAKPAAPSFTGTLNLSVSGTGGSGRRTAHPHAYAHSHAHRHFHQQRPAQLHQLQLGAAARRAAANTNGLSSGVNRRGSSGGSGGDGYTNGVTSVVTGKRGNVESCGEVPAAKKATTTSNGGGDTSASSGEVSSTETREKVTDRPGAESAAVDGADGGARAMGVVRAAPPPAAPAAAAAAAAGTLLLVNGGNPDGSHEGVGETGSCRQEVGGKEGGLSVGGGVPRDQSGREEENKPVERCEWAAEMTGPFFSPGALGGRRPSVMLMLAAEETEEGEEVEGVGEERGGESVASSERRDVETAAAEAIGVAKAAMGAVQKDETTSGELPPAAAVMVGDVIPVNSPVTTTTTISTTSEPELAAVVNAVAAAAVVTGAGSTSGTCAATSSNQTESSLLSQAVGVTASGGDGSMLPNTVPSAGGLSIVTKSPPSNPPAPVAHTPAQSLPACAGDDAASSSTSLTSALTAPTHPLKTTTTANGRPSEPSVVPVAAASLLEDVTAGGEADGGMTSLVVGSAVEAAAAAVATRNMDAVASNGSEVKGGDVAAQRDDVEEGSVPAGDATASIQMVPRSKSGEFSKQTHGCAEPEGDNVNGLATMGDTVEVTGVIGGGVEGAEQQMGPAAEPVEATPPPSCTAAVTIDEPNGEAECLQQREDAAAPSGGHDGAKGMRRVTLGQAESSAAPASRLPTLPQQFPQSPAVSGSIPASASQAASATTHVSASSRIPGFTAYRTAASGVAAAKPTQPSAGPVTACTTGVTSNGSGGASVAEDAVVSSNGSSTASASNGCSKPAAGGGSKGTSSSTATLLRKFSSGSLTMAPATPEGGVGNSSSAAPSVAVGGTALAAAPRRLSAGGTGPAVVPTPAGGSSSTGMMPPLATGLRRLSSGGVSGVGTPTAAVTPTSAVVFAAVSTGRTPFSGVLNSTGIATALRRQSSGGGTTSNGNGATQPPSVGVSVPPLAVAGLQRASSSGGAAVPASNTAAPAANNNNSNVEGSTAPVESTEQEQAAQAHPESATSTPPPPFQGPQQNTTTTPLRRGTATAGVSTLLNRLNSVTGGGGNAGTMTGAAAAATDSSNKRIDSAPAAAAVTPAPTSSLGAPASRIPAGNKIAAMRNAYEKK